MLALGRALDEAGLAPRLYASAQQIAGAALRLPAAFSGRLFLAYPLLPADVSPAGAQALEALRRRAGLDGQQPALQIGAYSAALLLAEGLKRAGRDASRERLLRELENLHALHTGVTPPWASVRAGGWARRGAHRRRRSGRRAFRPHRALCPDRALVGGLLGQWVVPLTGRVETVPARGRLRARSRPLYFKGLGRACRILRRDVEGPQRPPHALRRVGRRAVHRGLRSCRIP
ncbi:ABC transporter substrate-binding protein [Azotobacter chroococcum]